MIQRIPITDREQWLALRKHDVTASVIGALFGVHPYETALGVYLDKTGEAEPEPPNAMLEWRLILESAVGAAVERQRPEWKISKATEYLRDPAARIGATPDFYIHGDPRGLGVLQAKTVAPDAFRKHWDGDQPPFYIALQNACELMLETKATFGAVAALVINPYKLECPIFEIPRHAGVEARIREAAAKFWESVAWGEPPAPDYARDGALIAALTQEAEPRQTADLTGDNHLPVLLAEREQLKARLDADAARLAEIEAEVKFKMGGAEAAVIDGFSITYGWREAHTRPASHVAAHRALRIKAFKQESIDDGRPF